jgi:hypothetical protein
VADISRLHPLLQEALRTGKVPDRGELERLLGREIDDPEEDETPSDEGQSATPDPDEDRFRARYHAMVDERIADWLDEHPEHGNLIPAAERERIEDDCNRKIQYQWAAHRRALGSPDDEP